MIRSLKWPCCTSALRSTGGIITATAVLLSTHTPSYEFSISKHRILHSSLKLLIIALITNFRFRIALTNAKLDGTRLLVPADLDKFLAQMDDGSFMPCNYSRAIEFHKKYPQDVGSEAEDFRQRAQKLLEHAKKLLDELKVPFWLSSGTCLGLCYRLLS